MIQDSVMSDDDSGCVNDGGGGGGGGSSSDSGDDNGGGGGDDDMVMVIVMMMTTLQTIGGGCKFMCGGVEQHFGVIINTTKSLRISFRHGILRGIPQEFLEELFIEEYSSGAMKETPTNTHA
jgi:hypothetical protein